MGSDFTAHDTHGDGWSHAVGGSPAGVTAFDHLRLAGVTRLSLGGRGPRDAFVFDPHRLAFPCWALGLGARTPALLVTLDRHRDLVPPVAQTPDVSEGVAALDRFARESLDVRNVDHVLAAMDAGVLADALVIARSSPRGALEATPWTDRHGREHRLVNAPTVERVANGFGDESSETRLAQEARELIESHEHVVLDIDLDCFTSLSDADPGTVLPWPRAVIREFLLPAGSEKFWAAVLSRTRVLTFAREPYHVGGLVAGNRLFEDAAEVVFRELLGTDVP